MLFPDDNDPFQDQVCLEKEWHTLHYLITGTLEPDGSALGDAILGGEEIGTNLGYGPARLIKPERVKEIAEALLAVDIDKKCKDLDESTQVASDIYGGISTEPMMLQYYREFFRKLDNMYGSAAKHEQALLGIFGLTIALCPVATLIWTSRTLRAPRQVRHKPGA